MLRLTSPTALAALAFMLSLAGCGSGTPDATPSRSETVQPADTHAVRGNYIDTLVDTKKNAELKLMLADYTRAIGMFDPVRGKKPESIDALRKKFPQLADLSKIQRGQFSWQYDPATGEIAIMEKVFVPE
jgi:hypothetical protein